MSRKLNEKRRQFIYLLTLNLSTCYFLVSNAVLSAFKIAFIDTCNSHYPFIDLNHHSGITFIKKVPNPITFSGNYHSFWII
jgi:hypothetical protein